jgi:hypothetical protein
MPMNKIEMMRKLDSLFDQLDREHAFGAIEIEIRDGKPVVMRTTKTDKLTDTTGENNRGQRTYR